MLSPGTIVAARRIVRRADRAIRQTRYGVVWGLGIGTAPMRRTGPIKAAFVRSGPDVLAFLNSMKLLRVTIAGA
jgi:hypothetical protein